MCDQVGIGKYLPPFGLIKAMAVGCDPDSNPKAFDAACNEARVRPVFEEAYKEVEKARSDYLLALEKAWREEPYVSGDASGENGRSDAPPRNPTLT
jgi:hypothetical protein